ncbi:MAG: rod shape-determining protein MreD [Desulfobulbaceae bacterium DB1]|nr:MAG: rod shape-determining protein MreD [Desulfobulbaceae bacterium DB1]
MAVLSYFLIAVLLLILQTSLLPSLPDWMGRPDPLFVLIVFVALRFDIYRGAVLLLLLGLIMDIFSGIFLGIYPVTYLLLFALLKAVARKLAIHETAHRFPLVLSCYLLVNTVLFTFATFLAPENELSWNWIKILLQMLMISLFMPPLFALFDALDSWLTPRRAVIFFQRPKSKNTFRE